MSHPTQPCSPSSNESVKLLGDELVAFRRDLHAPSRARARGGADHRGVIASGSAQRAQPAAAAGGTGAAVRHRSTAGPGWSPCAPTSTRCRSTTRRTWPTGRPCPGSATPAVTTSTPRSLLGAGLALPSSTGRASWPGRVRLIFQPAEEVDARRGARRHRAPAAWTGSSTIFAVHCDPRLEVGTVGVRVGPITSSGGHGAGPAHRPRRSHRPAAPDRGPRLRARQRSSPSSRPCCRGGSTREPGLSVVWGECRAAAGAPTRSRSAARSRARSGCSTRRLGGAAEVVRRRWSRRCNAPYGVDVEVELQPRCPAVVNDARATEVLRRAATTMFGAAASRKPTQSLGGEDFAWYLGRVPGSLARLGVRNPDLPAADVDLHRATFDVDERVDRDRGEAAGRSRAALTARLISRAITNPHQPPAAQGVGQRTASAGLGSSPEQCGNCTPAQGGAVKTRFASLPWWPSSL